MQVNHCVPLARYYIFMHVFVIIINVIIITVIISIIMMMMMMMMMMIIIVNIIMMVMSPYYYVSLLLQELQVSEVITQPRSSGSSGMARRRKQTCPVRRALPSTSQVAEAPSTASNQPEGDGSGEQQESQPTVAPPNPRELLLALPQIVATRIPSEQSLERLKQFLSDNQPCDTEQVS